MARNGRKRFFDGGARVTGAISRNAQLRGAWRIGQEWEGGRRRQPAAITAGPVSSATIIAGSLPVYLRALPSAFLLLTVASPLRLCKGYALARRVEQRVGSRCLSGVSKRAAPRFRAEWNCDDDSVSRISSRGKIFVEMSGGKIIGRGNYDVDTVGRIRESSAEALYIYLRDTSYDGRFVETMAARWGTKDRLYRCEVYYSREISPT